MSSVANKLTSFAVLGVLVAGSYHFAPEETAALGNATVSWAKAAVSMLPSVDPAAISEGLRLPDAGNALPASAGTDPADYSFLAESPDGTPIRWDACSTIPVIVNASSAEPGAVDDVKESLAQITALTGLNFDYQGETSEIPQSDWYLKSWPNRDYPPLIIAWATPDTSSILVSNGDSGRASANPALINGESRYVTGVVVLNAKHNSIYEPGFGEGQTRGNLLLHEIGHAIGLGHAEHRGEMMNGEISPQTPASYAAGDLAGLAQLGSARGCAA